MCFAFIVICSTDKVNVVSVLILLLDASEEGVTDFIKYIKDGNYC